MCRSSTSEVIGDVRTCVGRMLSRNCPNTFRQWGSRRDKELGRFVLGGPLIVRGVFWHSGVVLFVCCYYPAGEFQLHFPKGISPLVVPPPQV